MNAASNAQADRKVLNFAMALSLAIALLMLVMKVGAYLLTGSAAILSDAAESVVHMAAVIFAAYSLRLSYKPADESHLYGHAKISFFSAGFEGAMIILAALYIIYESIHKWLVGPRVENLDLGVILIAAAASINGALGAYLLWLGPRKNSIIIQANGKHVLTDCWTGLAVLVGLGLVLITNWRPFDPICGIIVACNILLSGTGLMKTSFGGLMDRADPETQKKLVEILVRESEKRGLAYHGLRHRNLGDAHRVVVHLVFPADTSLAQAHREATRIEQLIQESLKPSAYVTTHLESSSDHDELHPDEQVEQANASSTPPRRPSE
jgi:cation diffusion facilitator family transporter